MTAPTNSDGTYTALEICGSDSAWVHCKIEYTRLPQNDPKWGSDIYDSYIKSISNKDTTYYTISEKGCALSCIAMVLTACGVDTDPGKLNRWKKQNNGYLDELVRWGVNPTEGKVTYKKSIPTTELNDLSILDKYLEECKLVVVKVINPDKNANHWVILAEKKKGTYHIVDPGYKDRKTLDEYGGKVYRAIIYEKL